MNSYVSTLLTCAMLLVACMYSSEVQAARDEFYFAPFFAPWPGQYYRPAWRNRYYAPSRKRKVVRDIRHNPTQFRKRQHTALAVPRGPTRVLQSISCEKAQAVIADYGFKDIKAEVCTGTTFGFTASRDGKPFSIRILAANGEFELVRRLR